MSIMATVVSGRNALVTGSMSVTLFSMLIYVYMAVSFIGFVIYGFKILSKKTTGEAMDKTINRFRVFFLMFVIPVLLLIVLGIVMNLFGL